MKTLSAEAKRARVEHDAFIIMLHAAITWPEKHDASDVLGNFWALAFPEIDIGEEDYNENLIDRIRLQLLIKSGVQNPILTENRFTREVKQNITF